MDKFKSVTYKINKDIYSICFASLIDVTDFKSIAGNNKDTL